MCPNLAKVHGRLYKSLFGEEPPLGTRLVGHGFSIRQGTFHFRSGVFNTSARNIDQHEQARLLNLEVKHMPVALSIKHMPLNI